MSEMVTFFQEHWILFLGLVIIVGLLVVEEIRSKVGGISQLSPQEVVDQINHKGAVLVDVREESVFKAGHIVGAINVPFQQFESKMNALTSYKNKPIIVVCYRGRSSLVIADRLKKAGFLSVYSMAGGMTAWQQASLPLEQ